VTDAAINRVSHNAFDLSLRLLAHIGSPRAYALAMTKCKVMQCAVRWQYTLVIARRKRSKGSGNPSCLP